MSSGLPPDAAAQAQARREAAANLGPLRKIILSLSSMLPANGGARPVREVLAWLRREDADRLNALRDELRREAAAACDVSDAEAKYWEAEGNKACGSGKFSEAVFMYTRGVMYAGEDEALASLLCGRSAVFLAQGRHGEALADAHAACMHAPNNWKALKHRGVCLQKMGLEEEGARDIHAAANTNAEAGNRREVICKILQACRNRSEMEITAPPRQKEGEEEKENNNNNNNNNTNNNNNNNNTNNNTNEEVSSQTTINITYKDNRKGVEANNRIEPGAVMTEAPVAHVLYDDHWCIRCCHCLRVTQALYPGASYRAKGKLSRGLFCSEECASQCWERYGQRETSNSFFHLCPMDALLAARMMSSDSALSARKSLRGDFTGELYPAAIIGGYETAVSLCAVMLSAVSEDDADRLRFAQRQVILCGFELKFFTGSQIIINTETNDAFIDTPQSIAIGKALYTSASQYRHSCDPNCFISFVGNPLGCSLSLTVRATRHVAAGEELTVAYHNMTAYKAVSAQVRRRALAERCGFICSCHACRENKEETVTAEKKNYYIQAGDLYQKGCRLIREGQYDVAVTVLSQSYTIAMEQLCPPPRPPQSMIPKTHMALARAFNRLGNNEKCVENLLAKSKLEHRLYGENHVEYVDDYIRLAYFADLENERRRFAEQAKACLARFYAPSRDLSRQMSRLDAFVLRKRD